MHPPPEIPSSTSSAGQSAQPPVIPPVATVAAIPPPILESTKRKGGFLRSLMSLCLILFLADAVASIFDGSIVLLFHVHVFTWVAGLVSFLSFLLVAVMYLLMGLTPMVPKRLFLPIALFVLLGELASIPAMLFFYGRLTVIGLIVSSCQLLVGLAVLRFANGTYEIGWPLVAEEKLGKRRFSWGNLILFLLGNLVILLPGVAAYLCVCAGLAVGHYSEGFLMLRPGGLTVQARKYARDDGKTVELFPMSHVGEADFYQKVSASFPSNAVVLMEGVTDDKGLLTNKITYKRMATSLGLSEQHEEFQPAQNEVVDADVDVSEFSKTTIDFLNFAMLIHSKGLTPELLVQLLTLKPPPNFQEQLWDDILMSRNRHLLEELKSRLTQSDHFVIPWGVAHMPGIAAEIQKSGFHLVESQNYVAIRFHVPGKSKSTKHTLERSRKTGE